MAWYPGAQKLELQPESDAQEAIRPTQFILHSIAAPWTPQRTYEYWRDSTNLESHFGVGFDGSCAQFIGTQTRADANYRANARPDGTGAVSVETASNLDATDPWTPAQIETLIKIGVWLHQQHDIPLRICRTADDPGYGYHRLHAAWSTSGTNCPGDARVQQFREAIFPGIVARAGGQRDPQSPQETVVPFALGEYTGATLSLPPNVWTTLTVGRQDLISGAQSYTATAFLTLKAKPGGVLQGRFYHQKADGSRWDGPIVERICTEGSSFADFTHAGSISSGETVRFEITYAPTSALDTAPATITAARARGLYWK
ncbi:peptidoglycan recognition protein family protein [Streptomyces albireticuli]|uniref:N-acetylmuramoyl-L-alanine amidase n=1 Tax=Streptomyces albireticuli TaxID=1940 RepID=A0A2A2D148_9ACTN|nr:N-acetylmuramoyl-L-alanine amidase [Streptomyces albireticuli]MCD9196085.1 N-acetylmuramoyl-L-alanine amidase [Streptomyces albireticuli]PAU46163.1 N-acetylmuramoyl-L-alanine amidase [Streptomyces albireticuli]